jgi:hypothetical protein
MLRIENLIVIAILLRALLNGERGPPRMHTGGFFFNRDLPNGVAGIN